MSIYRFDSRISNPRRYPFGYADGKQLFTPADITTELWIDAADSDTITLDSNSRVALWEDKSGNANGAAEISSGYGPTVIEKGQNRLDVVYGGGDPYGMTISGPVVSGSTNRTVFVVGKYGNQIATGMLLSLGEDDGSTIGQVFQMTPEVGVRVRSGSRIASSVAPISRHSIVSYVSTNGFTSGLNMYLDGVGLSISATTNAGLATAGDSTIFYKGGGSGNEFSPSGSYLCEAIVTSEAESTHTRQLVEGYLAWKWGLESKLPATHPYKTGAPRQA